MNTRFLSSGAFVVPAGKSCLELVAQQLASGVARQRGSEAHQLGDFIAGQPLTTEVDQLGITSCHSTPQLDRGRRHVAPARVGQSDDGSLLDSRVRQQHRLDLGWVDVLAAGE